FLLQSSRAAPDLHSFPTRRSSDLAVTRRNEAQRDANLQRVMSAQRAHALARERQRERHRRGSAHPVRCPREVLAARAQPPGGAQDRKSTRLNSSHSQISYAVFCLK